MAGICSAIRLVPCLGPRLEVDLKLVGENPKLPYFFYIMENALLQLGPRGATLCGVPSCKEELEAFLSLHGITRLITDGWYPEGWPACALIPMEFIKNQPLHHQAGCLDVQEYDINPSTTEVVEVVQLGEGYDLPAFARDAFYAETCLRRSRGYADVRGIRCGGKLVSTAGMYAITEDEAHIACVATLPQYRGKGYASFIISELCGAYGSKRVTLLCEPAMQGFYTKLGFVPMEGKVTVATLPQI